MGINLIGGKIEVSGNGYGYHTTGNFTLNLGKPKREGLTGPDQKVHGYKEVSQIPSIKGMIRKTRSMNISKDILDMTDATITVKGADGTRYLYESAYYSGEGTIELENGEVPFECEARSATEISP